MVRISSAKTSKAAGAPGPKPARARKARLDEPAAPPPEGGALRVERSVTTLRERTLDVLRRAILSQHFKPGQRLVERELCEQLAVSRTVVREVLRYLEAEGLVENLPNAGPAIARPTLDEVRQIYELRGQLEGLAARACAERSSPDLVAALEAALAAIRTAYADRKPPEMLLATNEFYRILFEVAGRSVAWGIVSSLKARITYLRAITTATPGRDQEGPAQMARIVEAIRDGDGEAAVAACLAHVERAFALASRALAEDPPPPQPLRRRGRQPGERRAASQPADQAAS